MPQVFGSATRIVLLLLVTALVVGLFVPVNDQMVAIFKDALLLVLGAFFGMKITEKPAEDQLSGK